MLDAVTYLDALRWDSAALAAAGRAGLGAAVTSCPGWTVGDLLAHVGMVHGWVTSIVASRATERPQQQEFDGGDPAVQDWFEANAATVHDVLSTTEPGVAVWSWADLHTVGFWQRRMSHETAVHRWDGEGAYGEPAPFEPRLAADGVDEYLTIFAPRRALRAARRGAGESFHLHCTDTDGEWLVRMEPGGVLVTPEHAKADVAVRGLAGDLLLWVWGRIPADRLEVVGDAALAGAFRDLVPE